MLCWVSIGFESDLSPVSRTSLTLQGDPRARDWEAAFYLVYFFAEDVTVDTFGVKAAVTRRTLPFVALFHQLSSCSRERSAAFV